MSAEEFQQWLDHMKELGKAEYDKQLAAMLGVSHFTLLHYKKCGTPHRVALACRALADGRPAYGTPIKKSTNKGDKLVTAAVALTDDC